MCYYVIQLNYKKDLVDSSIGFVNLFFVGVMWS